MNRAVFLDRDGVINEEPPHYAHRLDQLKMIARSATAVQLLNANEFIVIVVSNQAGIAHGYFREEDTIKFNRAIKEALAKENAYFNAIYYCPHHPAGEVELYEQIVNAGNPGQGC